MKQSPIVPLIHLIFTQVHNLIFNRVYEDFYEFSFIYGFCIFIGIFLSHFLLCSFFNYFDCFIFFLLFCSLKFILFMIFTQRNVKCKHTTAMTRLKAFIHFTNLFENCSKLASVIIIQCDSHFKLSRFQGPDVI